MRPTNAPSRPSTSPNSGRLARVSADPAPLFVYGTLLFPDVLRVLIDRDATRTPATIHGWQAIALPHVVYPTLIPRAQTSTTGELLTDLTDTEWRTLDAFEDERYHLAALTTNGNATAYAYVDTPDGHDETRPWDKTTFARTHLPAYLERCTAWRHHYNARHQ